MTNLLSFRSAQTNGLKCTVVEIILPDEPIAPGDLSQLLKLNVPTEIYAGGVVLTGRAPIWLYACLTHFFHPSAWLATNDPRLGAVVVATHSKAVFLGQVLTFPVEEVAID